MDTSTFSTFGKIQDQVNKNKNQHLIKECSYAQIYIDIVCLYFS